MSTAKAPTLTEISRIAGCSKAAASAVLNGSKGNISVGETLRARVVEVARELNYRPNHASRSLALRRTQSLGIYLPRGPWGGLGGQYEGEVLYGVEAACLERQYNLSVINVAGNAPPERCLATLGEQRIDGLLVLHVEGDEPWLAELVDQGHAVAAIDCDRAVPGLDAVSFDHQAAIDLAVDHLVSLGHERIGYLGTCTIETVPHNELRRDAFVKSMKARGLAFDARWVFGSERCDHPVRRGGGHLDVAGRRGAEYMISLDAAHRPTAVIAYDDSVATSAVRAWVDAGVSVPRDISLVNVEDTRLCRNFIPRLTTVRHPLREMGERAAELLIERAMHRDDGVAPAVGRHETFPPELTVRESTAAPSLPGVTP